MRKLICLTTLCCGLLFCASNARSDKPADENAAFQTTWELVSVKMSCMPNEPGDFPKERQKIKILQGNRFVWIDYERASGKVLSSAGGTFALKGAQYTEKIEFATKNVEFLVGKTFVFEVKLDKDKLLQSGSLDEDTQIEETWRKAASSPAAVLASQSTSQPKN